MKENHRYWDSNIFLAWISEEAEKEKHDSCLGVMKAFTDKKIQIVTSALTWAEVLWVKGKPRIGRESEAKVKEALEDVIPINLDQVISNLAQQIVWDHNVHSKDAIHVATALRAKIPIFDTFDKDLLDLNGKFVDLRFTVPDIPYQETLIDANQPNKN